MEVAFVLFLLFVYFPAAFGVVANIASTRGYVNDSVPSYIAKIIRFSSADTRYIVAILIFLICIVPVFVYKRFVDSVSGLASVIALALMVLMLIVSAVSIYSSPLIRGFYRKYFCGINIVVVMLMAINASRATSYAEGIISSLVGVRASELPTGLVWMSIIMAPVAWAITISMWSMAAHVVIFLYAIFNETHDAKRRKILAAQGFNTKLSSKIPNGLLLALGFAVLAVSPVSMVSFLLKSPGAEKIVREELVDASFHVSAEECEIKGILGAKIAYLETGKALVAIPDEKLGFQFARVECAKNWSQPADIENSVASINADFDKTKYPESLENK